MTEDEIDYPPEKRKKHIKELASWIKEKDFFNGVNMRLSFRTIDFYIGGVDEYANSEVKTVGTSSIAASQGVEKAEEGLHVGDIKIHFPPAKEELEEDIRRILELREEFSMHTGTTALGGVTPAPNGVITPHIYTNESIEIKPIKELLEKCHKVYVKVYDKGERTLMEIPEQD